MVLFVLSQAVVPPPPSVAASGEKVVSYYHQHSGGLRLSVWLLTIAGLPFVPVVALLRRRLVGISRDVMFFGAIGLGVQTTTWSWFIAGMALHPDVLDPRIARTLTDIAAFYGPTLTASTLLFVAPIGLAAWSGRSAFPKWLAPITAVFVVEQAIETLTIFGRRGFMAPAGGMNFILGAGLFLIWFVAVGVAVSGDDEQVTHGEHRIGAAHTP
ncbi:MAG: hypothetical protein NVSMB16_01030 [Acidimicrobiales bacterium]